MKKTITLPKITRLKIEGLMAHKNEIERELNNLVVVIFEAQGNTIVEGSHTNYANGELTCEVNETE
jgi:hypothetical protein